LTPRTQQANAKENLESTDQFDSIALKNIKKLNFQDENKN
jgi:hypothetical protein